MDIHFIIRKGEFLPHVESFFVQHQKTPCPPEIMTMLVHKVIADVSQDNSLREFDFPFKTCPVHVTIDVLDEMKK